MRDDAGRLQDILESIQRIEERIGVGRQRFETDEMLQVLVVYHLQIIGEAARSMSQASRVAHPEIPWTDVIAMRNLLVHTAPSATQHRPPAPVTSRSRSL